MERHFPVGPKVFDLTEDTPHEYIWQPIKKPDVRTPPNEKDPENAYDYVYDRREVDRELLDKLYVQGQNFRKNYKTAAECNADQEFWD